MSLFKHIARNTKLARLERQLDEAYNDLSRTGVNHILHLLLSIITGGVWVIVWVLVAITTPSESGINRRIRKLEKELERFEDGIVSE